MIYENCWNEIFAGNCIYSGHTFNGDELQVFIEQGLDTWPERLQKHVQTNGSSGVGKCVLIFGGVSKYQWRETPFMRSPTGQVVWGEAATQQFGEDAPGAGEQYFLDGTALDALKSVWVEIRARRFAIDAQ